MKTLISKARSELLNQLSIHDSIGSWRISFPAATISKQTIQTALLAFKKNFEWLKIYQFNISYNPHYPQDTLWRQGSNLSLDDWLMSYGDLGIYEDLPTVIASAELCFTVQTPDGQFDSFQTGNVFDSFEIIWEEEKEQITLEIELFFNLFTKAAYPYFGTDVYDKLNVIDISPECRKHNRDLLANSLNGLAKDINGEVLRFYKTDIGYINEHGFSDDCENEKIYDITKGESYKPES
jgi:hypothetical protein